MRHLISLPFDPTAILTIPTSIDTMWADKLESAYERREHHQVYHAIHARPTQKKKEKKKQNKKKKNWVGWSKYLCGGLSTIAAEHYPPMNLSMQKSGLYTVYVHRSQRDPFRD